MLEDALQLPEDYAALKAWALDKAAALETTRQELLQAQTGLVGATLLIEKLKIELARLKRETYGTSSEKLARIDQLELQLEDLEESVAAAPPATYPRNASAEALGVSQPASSAGAARCRRAAGRPAPPGPAGANRTGSRSRARQGGDRRSRFAAAPYC